MSKCHVIYSLLLQVLPRQTCHLFTHITKYEDIIGGKDQLIAYAEGDVFSTILYNPVSQ